MWKIKFVIYQNQQHFKNAVLLAVWSKNKPIYRNCAILYKNSYTKNF